MPDIDRLEKASRLPLSLHQVSPYFAAEFASCRQSFSYFRLPVHLLNLTVLKLDGSSFDVHVARTATVRELKVRVEEVFGQFEMAGEIESISWGHVWGQFCLSYRGLKLIDEKALLRNLGVKDCDQLEFVRHLPISCSRTKERPRLQEIKEERRRKSWPKALDFELQSAIRSRKASFKSLNECIATDIGEDEDLCAKNQWLSKLSRYLKGFLCYSNPIYMTQGSITQCC